jgi:hypothetical protein
MSGRAGEIITDIVEDGLVFNMDAANRASYPKTGTPEYLHCLVPTVVIKGMDLIAMFLIE